MKKILLALFIAIPALALALDPATICMTNMRSEEVSAASADTFYRGDVIHFTNCVVLSGSATNSAVQDLTGLAVVLSWGDTVVTASSVTGSVTSTAGVWNASVTLGASDGVKTFFQLKLTNSTSSFTYPFKYINVKSKL